MNLSITAVQGIFEKIVHVVACNNQRVVFVESACTAILHSFVGV